MIRNYLAMVAVICALQGSAQDVQNLEKLFSGYFHEMRNAAEIRKALWGKSIYGPILLVDPATRKVYANEHDPENVLGASGEIFTGQLPYQINIANKSLHWLGKNWAMIMLPLPADKHDRLELMGHELFHVQQPLLGFRLFNPENNHLDIRDGRIWLKLECEALLKALEAESAGQAHKYLEDALGFRMKRHSIFPESDSTENRLELNEGITEYTGIMISGRNGEEMNSHLIKKIRSFLNNPSFVRSFAYHTTPVYGHFANKLHPGWVREVDTVTNLTSFFARIPSLKPEVNALSFTSPALKKYNAGDIIATENKRENLRTALLESYRSVFLHNPHLEIPFRQMNISFNPDNLIPLDDYGTVYPNLRITDQWGILTVEKGALITSGWEKVIVGNPAQQTGKLVTGDGWKLELNEGYAIVRDDKTGNSQLVKQ